MSGVCPDCKKPFITDDEFDNKYNEWIAVYKKDPHQKTDPIDAETRRMVNNVFDVYFDYRTDSLDEANIKSLNQFYNWSAGRIRNEFESRKREWLQVSNVTDEFGFNADKEQLAVKQILEFINNPKEMRGLSESQVDELKNKWQRWAYYNRRTPPPMR
jgi:C-terminal processing protease CtpA/Prc